VANATSAYNNMSEVTVPAGQVFMLGDNRDNSLDSRARTHGTIAVTNLRGRVTDIGFSRDLTRLGLWVGTPR
jgi:signal peptidase I